MPYNMNKDFMLTLSSPFKFNALKEVLLIKLVEFLERRNNVTIGLPHMTNT